MGLPGAPPPPGLAHPQEAPFLPSLPLPPPCRYLFWAGLVDRLTQEHLWLSVVTCSAWSPFSRVQRLSCCLALLLCSMLINIMLWRGAEEEEEEQPPGEDGARAARGGQRDLPQRSPLS